jgi:glycosyltransferase involved in cell wall biosynthesis
VKAEYKKPTQEQDSLAGTGNRRLPMVTVIMPVRNEESFIERSLNAVLAQDYPPSRMEVLIADGMSTDRTRAVVDSLRDDHSNVRLIDNENRLAPSGLNIATEVARGDVIVRVDGHCEIDRNYVRRCVHHLAGGDIDAVGGVIETVGETKQAQTIAAAMSSPFGVGLSAFRVTNGKTSLVDTLAFPAYKRETVRRTGLYDEEFLCNEDDEYNYRLRKLGGRILLAEDVCSRYYSRCTLLALGYQYFRYGMWKVRVLQKHPRQMKLRQFVPFAFVTALMLSLGAVPLVAMGRWALILVAGSYLTANLCASLWTASRNGWWMAVRLPIVFSVLHLSYGFGFLAGLARFWKHWRERETRLTSCPPHMRDARSC